MQKWSRLLYQPALPLYGDRRVTGCDEHIRISRKAASEGMVLLENDGTLPLAKDKPVALFGKGSVDYVKGGGGSGDVYCKYVHSLYDGLTAKGVSVFEPLISFYKDDLKHQYENGRVPGMTAEPVLTDELLKGAIAYTDTAIIVISRFSGEGWDRSDVECNNEYNPWESETSMPKIAGEIFPDGDFYLTKEEKALVATVKKNFKRVIAVVNIGGVIDLTWLKEDGINAALYMGQGGMEGGDAAADILLGTVNPSGRLVDTFAGKLDDYPSTKGFHESFDYVNYNEDIYVGYRYFLTIPGAAQKIVYPFGYGLSYTTFQYNNLRLSSKTLKKGESVTIQADITNSGSRDGAEVIQLYAHCNSNIERPKKQLVGFERVELAAGETKTVTFTLAHDQLSYFNETNQTFDVESGEVDIYVAASSADVRLQDKLNTEAATVKHTYKSAPTGIFSTNDSNSSRPANSLVYSIQGNCVGTTAQFYTLPHGMYVVNGKKIIK